MPASLPEDQLVPYAPDFTPTLLGREVGADQVLEWLLRTATDSGSKRELMSAIVSGGLGHIRGEKNRRDMASHVVQGLQNYRLVEIEGDAVSLTRDGARILSAEVGERDRLFAVHILSKCNGLRFVDEIRRLELRGETPTMEDLAFLDRHATSKNLSTMRAWLARAGVVSAKGSYSVDVRRLDELLGERAGLLFGLSREEAEFLFAARTLMLEAGRAELAAAHVADLAETRNPDVVFRRKSIGQLLAGLEKRGLIALTGRQKGKGGSKLTFELQWEGIEIGDEELRGCIDQAGFLLTELEPIASVLERLERGSTAEQGRAGEMLAIHVCLMLGLRNVHWRKRAPHSEIDLIADRAVGLSYQRWALQVKNTAGDLSSDRVDREVGAAAGTGVSHVLFVVPRAGLSAPARAETLHRSRLTHLHVFHLDQAVFSDERQIIPNVLATLRAQSDDLATIKREEAERRERTGSE